MTDADHYGSDHASDGIDRDLVIPRLERLLEKATSARGVRHAAAGASSLDGSWVWTEAAGDAHPGSHEMTADTPWFLASVTKLYIASVVLRLHELGDVDLDTSIATLLPSDLASGLHILDGVDRTADITVAHLLAHASGLPDWLAVRPKGGRDAISELEESDRAFTFEEKLALARAADPHFAPSDLDEAKPRVRYSDTNYQLLMFIAERVTGSSMADLHRTLLFEPLGLEQTWFPGHAPPSVTPATIWIGDWSMSDRPLALRSIGDLFATTADILRFGRALFSGRVFEHRSTASHMQRRFNRFGIPRSLAAVASPSWPIEYGMGMMRFAPTRAMALGRRLPAVVGHSGATGSWLWFAPSLGVVLAGTVDQSSRAAFPFQAVPAAIRGLDR